MYRILLVEDDAALADAIRQCLQKWGYEVVCAVDFQKITEQFLAQKPHLVLLDIHLPYYNGYHWCNEIRRYSQVPVVFLSSSSDSMNVVMAVNMGGDDFLAKPVDPAVLNAKVQAILRRTYELNRNEAILEFSGAVLDLAEHRLLCNGKEIPLTKNEFLILHTLLQNKGKIVSRDQLMLRLWQDDCYVETNTLTVNVARLRKKLESVGLADCIVTKQGSGYLIE